MDRPHSLWLATAAPHRDSAALKAHTRADVVVVGAGIAGVTTAYLLSRAGIDVVLLEAGTIGSGATGHTTAKVSSAHGLCYDALGRKHDDETAATYARLNEHAIGMIEEIMEREAIDCHWRRRDAFLYALGADAVPGLEDEVLAARSAGLAAELVGATPLPFEVAAAMRVSGQAEFNPVEWVRGLARAAVDSGARLFEHSRVVELDHHPGGPSPVVSTESGSVTADHVVIATHYPILDRGLFFARMSAQRSYCIAAHATASTPEGMFLSIDGPTRSLRAHHSDRGDMVIIGGEGHAVGQDEHTVERYAALESWAREHLAITSVEYRWSAQDAMSPDGLPYVGAINPLSNRVLVATGFAKWGMTGGTAAAVALRDRILGEPHAGAEILDSNRFDPIASGPAIAKHNATTARHFFGDRFTGTADATELAPGSGAIVRDGIHRVAAYRDDDGALHEFSSSCTHLGCELRFNDAERSWDCPCHGSRFGAVGGGVIEGPAVKGLRPVRALR